ncbi:MAG: TAXI family TRAP transporter solute-binding subunit [Rhodospirillales bacterium]|jgi:hypothetical protein|nr:TAXI family TRAP transporter solute-binding subunit [Rhodospirillales bacterium]MBT4005627.1 TAXI family TRAP transporter solute-binding subunit [Rhodospirillales bacterium]MBT5075116.1 TAXI family TRAP transporter solute-binding subunit [Rhodospirillales bacterium]MBT5112975.1 TAXI family TRAP transporter solute-binding subunit [Rhodospirillales bacterium]MBT5672851.1 TAXI family TRAP transporter solute-binding subunit [Rhodospirillales bacterium]
MFRLFASFVCIAILGFGVSSPKAQEMKFFRIGTGSISGIYFPVGGLLASAISNPSGATLCGRGGSCGVAGLVAVAQASRGSIANIKTIAQGKIESGLAQADMAYFAANGKDLFKKSGAIRGLRAIANLYPEAVHIVVRRSSKIRSIDDLGGKRISLDLRGSGTRNIARRILQGYGITLKDIRQVNSQIGPAMDRLRAGTIDAFFFVGGFPAPAIERLSHETPINLLPMRRTRTAAIRITNPFLAKTIIPTGTYGIKKAVETLSVGALWLVSDKMDEKTVYGITRALWHPTTRAILDQGPPATRQIRVENALNGVVIPLHAGARRYYREKGMLAKHRP